MRIEGIIVKDYSKIVISIITSDGLQFDLLSSPNDYKHVVAYKRLVNEMSFDRFRIMDYIHSRGHESSITGFELSEFVSASGNVVFFHTDVSNSFLDRRQASIMIPEIITDVQKKMANQMLSDLDGFSLYMGQASFSQAHRMQLRYQRLSSDSFRQKLAICEETPILNKHDFFEENSILVIDSDGKAIALPRVEAESNHSQAFLRLEKEFPGILDDYPEDIKSSGGFELASFIGAHGFAVIWPSDINNPNIMIVTLPYMTLPAQGRTVCGYLPFLEGRDVYASVVRFKKYRSSKVVKESLAGSGDYFEAVDKITDYVRKAEMLHEMLEDETKIIVSSSSK